MGARPTTPGLNAFPVPVHAATPVAHAVSSPIETLVRRGGDVGPRQVAVRVRPTLVVRRPPVTPLLPTGVGLLAPDGETTGDVYTVTSDVFPGLLRPPVWPGEVGDDGQTRRRQVVDSALLYCYLLFQN